MFKKGKTYGLKKSKIKAIMDEKAGVFIFTFVFQAFFGIIKMKIYITYIDLRVELMSRCYTKIRRILNV